MNTKTEPRGIETLIQTYRAAYDVLCETSDLSPRNPLINRTLSALVAATTSGYSPVEAASPAASCR